jgi:Amt family ammonium transporter
MLGKRKETGPPHNVVLTMIGAGLLWVGWFGFNAGSAVSAGMQAGMAMAVTHICTATAGFTWMLVEWMMRGKPTLLGICSGAVAGLVVITPASGFVGPMGAFAMGIAAGIVCYWGCTGLKHMFGYDDALDCFGVHCVGGIVGALLTGVFAYGPLSATDASPDGTSGSLHQLFIQSEGVAATLVYSGIGTLILLFITNALVGLRVNEEEEREGLDLVLHGEQIF